MEALIGLEGLGQAAQVASASACPDGPVHGKSQPGQKSRPHGDDDFCCSSLQTLGPNVGITVLAKPANAAPTILHLLSAGPAPAFDPPAGIPLRHARHPKWVFTPEVCLGPAMRSLAPPFATMA